MDKYHVKIGDDYTDDDGLSLEMGQLARDQAWWEVPIPPCPDCGGDVVWHVLRPDR